ncbi:hypothetical protein [Albidovulum sediminis]|uniref:Translation initiation factor 2 n=1 Tax=Albidovulum sediminis TaxID=3066345 RepID=A0ABT2NJC9_9RHOB|nr:hypothetical protein [Defluviimonas sediminis]MCT8328049.1 hypothetical protein [Defluviimonas sediminis]
MKPGFALSLSDERIDLLARTPGGWAHLGTADPASDDLDAQMAALRARAAASAPDGFQTKVILPPSQILYAEVSAPGPDQASRRAQIEAALDGRTPYRVDELVFDWSGDGPVVQVAVVARLTLDEAEGFAEEHDFAPVAFVTVPEPGQFAGEPFFGPTKRQAAHLPAGAQFERDTDPVRLDQPPLPAADAADMVEEEESNTAAEPAPAPEAVPEPVAEAVAKVEPGADEEAEHPEAEHPDSGDKAETPPAQDMAPAEAETAPADPVPAAPASAMPEADESADESADEAPFADMTDEGDIFADFDGDWRSVRPVVDDTDAPAEDSPAGAAPVPGFASHRPAALAGAATGAAGPSRLEAITSRIQMTQTRGAAPKAPPAPQRPATPPRAQPLLRSPSLPPLDPGAAEAGDTLIRALDRVRAPVGVAEQRQRHQRNRRMLGTATTAAAVLFAGVAGLWWWYFETRPAQPEPQTIATAPEAAAPAAVQAPAPAPEPAAEPAAEATPATEEAAAPDAEAVADSAAPTPAETVVEVEPAATPETALQTAPETAPEAGQRAPVAAGPDEPAPALPELAPAIAANPAPDAEVGRPGAASESAVALAPPAALSASGPESSDRPAPAQPVPAAFGALQRFDADGNIIATAEGVRTPQGFLLIAGRPDAAPPARPAEIQALAAALAAASAPAATEPAEPVEGLDAAAAPAPAEPEPAAESVPQPLDPATAAKRPVTRPAAIQPPAPEPVVPEPGATEPATSEPSITAPDDQASAAPPPPDPVTAARQPLSRPAAIAAAAPVATPETEPAPVVTASRYAVATSPSPTARPNLLNRAVEQALAAALAEAAPDAPAEAAAEAPADVADAHEELDEPEPEAPAPDIPTTANVAKNATIANAIDLGELSLIGIVGSASRQRALVRTSKGRILTVSVGDKLDGGKVSGIGDGQLTYVKNGKTHVLKMTNKG